MKKIFLIIIYSIIGRAFLKFLLGIKTINRKNIYGTEQFIIASNHNSHLDTVAIMAAIPSKVIAKVHPVAAGDYFASSSFKKWITHIFTNAIFIPRTKSEDKDASDPINIMEQTILKGDSIILFPEGTRGTPEVMQRFRRGVGILLNRTPDIKVIPVYCSGLGKSLPKGDLILVPFNSMIIVGEPFLVKSKAPEEIAKEIEDKILELQHEHHN